MTDTVRVFLAGAGIILLGVFGIRLFPRRGNRTPVAERACRALLLFGRWIQDVATAWDHAIVEYRRLHEAKKPVLASTFQRENQA